MPEDRGKASTRAKNRYNAKNYDNLRIIVPKGKKEVIRQYAADNNESINAFVNRAIDETMKNGCQSDSSHIPNETP